jgi:excisionase family DNA binding protein
MGVAVPDRDLECLSDAQVAQVLSCSKKHVANLRLRGLLPFLRIGRCVRILRCNLERYIKDNTTTIGGSDV